MKKLTFWKSLFLLCALIVGSSSAWGQASVGTTLWSEDFSGFNNNVDPSGDYTNSHTGTTIYGGVTVTYSKENGGGTTQTYTSGGPNSNSNLLIAKQNGKFIVSGIPTGDATELTVSYAKSGSGTVSISSSTTGVIISGSASGSTITTKGATSLALTFENTAQGSSANLRIDDISVTVKTAGTPSKVATPQFSPAAGTYNNNQTVTITSTTTGATIRYTTDGTTEPSKTVGTVYDPENKPVINATTTIKAIAYKDNLDDSDVAEALYTMVVETPTLSVETGTYNNDQTVTISTTTIGATIRYTTDGITEPSETEGTVYDPENKPVINATTTFKAKAFKTGYTASGEVSATYTLKCATPTFSEAEGKIAKGTAVTLSTETTDADIYYTTDGSDPTSASTKYTDPITVNASQTIKAVAIKTNYSNSGVATAEYEVVVPIAGYTIDFETDDLDRYVDWDFSNVGLHSGITGVSAHSGTKWGSNVNSGDNATSTAYIKTKSKIAHPGTFTCYVSKESNNTSSSTWYVQYSTTGGSNNSEWTNAGSLNAANMDKGVWNKLSVDISAQTNVYVRLYYTGSNAKRAVDDIVLTERDITLGTSNLLSYCSADNLNFSGIEGLKVYKAKVDEEQAVLTEIADGIVPANTGVILSGTAGDSYTIPLATAEEVQASTTDFTDNEMVGVTKRTQVLWNPSDGVYNYILQQGQFNKATNGYLKANRAYLSTSYDVTAPGAKALTIVFNDATTGINGVEEISPVTMTRKVVKNGRLVIETPNGEFTIDGAKVK